MPFAFLNFVLLSFPFTLSFFNADSPYSSSAIRTMVSRPSTVSLPPGAERAARSERSPVHRTACQGRVERVYSLHGKDECGEKGQEGVKVCIVSCCCVPFGFLVVVLCFPPIESEAVERQLQL
jgi:hypothetical protein